ncbi:unnamed protein product [Vicia faba]|uniref:Arginase n=1 Tax=Vicia faba TaxID=3906 RepID=A0AAV0Z588_VICFA|nr:unnamed protein product [Vicia faba]
MDFKHNATVLFQSRSFLNLHLISFFRNPNFIVTPLNLLPHFHSPASSMSVLCHTYTQKGPKRLKKLGEGVKGVYISIDVDCLDPAFAPGVSHIEPGGLSFRDVLNILHNLQGDVVAGDVVELNPQRDTVDGMTAMVAAKLVREMAAKIAK